MSIRDVRQAEWANIWMEHNKGILFLCPRSGKIKTCINIFNKLPPDLVKVVVYPDATIRNSWKTDFEKFDYSSENVVFSTYRSLHKLIGKTKNSLLVFDEIHLSSEAQRWAMSSLMKDNKLVIGLTGTMSEYTERDLWRDLELSVLVEYPIEKAIEEGIVTDYQVTVVMVPLDGNIRNNYRGKWKTEKQQFVSLSRAIMESGEKGYDTMFLRLERMRIIQNSLAKLKKTQWIIEQYKNERLLVFCGVTAIADRIGIPSHHSKSDNTEVFKNFASGVGNHLAVVRIGNTGVTYKPLNKVIINYFSSSEENMVQQLMRCMSYEYDNESKKAEIFIVCTTESVEEKWLDKALKSLNPDKIKWV